MFLNLPRDVIRSKARFRLCVHTLRFETVTWNQSNSPTKNDDVVVTCVILKAFFCTL